MSCWAFEDGENVNEADKEERGYEKVEGEESTGRAGRVVESPAFIDRNGAAAGWLIFDIVVGSVEHYRLDASIRNLCMLRLACGVRLTYLEAVG